MKAKLILSITRRSLTALFAALILTLACGAAARAQTSAFTYQGRLTEAQATASGVYDFQFALFDPNNFQLGILTREDVVVTNGVFTVQLDFGAAVFSTQERVLEIGVRRGAETGAFTVLTPRQRVTSAPLAVQSLRSAFSGLATNSENLGGTAANQFLLKNGDGSALTNLNGANIAAGTIANSSLSSDARSRFDTNLVALLRWDLLPNFKTIVVGNNPYALAFDGTFIYVANRGGNTVIRIRAATGTVEGAPIPIVNGSSALAFDGTFINVASENRDTVTRIRAATGTVEGAPIPVPQYPSAVAFDGTFIYVNSQNTDTVTRIRASTGAVEGAPIPVGFYPRALFFDGTFIYVANYYDAKVTRIRASTGAVEGAPIPVGTRPIALAFDGVNIYVANNGGTTVTKFVP